jgi:Methyltransferase domain
MPSSYAESFPPIVHCLIRRDPRRVLDIGPGWGKYGLVCREYLPALELLDAVEVPQGRLPTQTLYDTVYIGDVRHAPATFFCMYDLVMLVDVIEHVPIEEGHELLDRIQNAGADVLVSTPNVFFHQHVEHNPHEEHLSFWAATEFDRHHVVEDISTVNSFIYVLKGAG